MPGEFEVSVSELLHRVPAKFIRPGGHDATRMLRIPAGEVAPGLVRGRAEISLARLVALAPDLFRREKGESDDLAVRLPIQKLLQQIGSHPFMPAAKGEVPPAEAPVASSELAAGTENVAAHLPTIVWEKPVEPDVPPPKTGEAVAEPAISASVEAAAHEPRTAEPAAPFAAATQPTILAAPGVPVLRTMELRPANDVSISSTLRAVVLGGKAAGSSPEAGQILAPRSAPPAESSVFLAPADAGPSILPSPAGGSPAADFAGLQSLFMSSAPLDLAGVAALTAALPGVHACLICGAAGSAEAGEMPPGLNVEEVRGASEEFARKIGGVESTTIHRGDLAIAIFTRGGVCLSAVTDSAGFVPGVRDRLLSVTELLAGTPSVA